MEHWEQEEEEAREDKFDKMVKRPAILILGLTIEVAIIWFALASCYSWPPFDKTEQEPVQVESVQKEVSDE